MVIAKKICKAQELTKEKQHALGALLQKPWSYEPWPTEVLAFLLTRVMVQGKLW